MPLYLRGQLILLWIILLWFCIKTVHSDAVPYGERIQPLKGVVKKVKLTACETCYNKTTVTTNNTNNRDEQSSKRIYKRLGTNIRREDAGPLTNSNPLTLSVHNVNPLEKTQQTATPIYSGIPKENIKNRGATFFFTQVEPHRYEYRAMFQHHKNNFQQTEVFNPFVQNFDPFTRDFPPLPKFPAFGEISQIFTDHKDPFPNFPDKDLFPNFPDHKDPFPNFPDHKDPFPNFPEHKDPFRNFPEITFPTLSPVIKRAWEPDVEVRTQRPALEKDLNGPLAKKYDVVLGHQQYPKIFRFNDERINIEDFDREKKLRLYKLSKSDQNEILEPENVKRDQLLILHGGIFTVKEPPLFNKHVRKIRKSHIFGSKVS